MTAKSEKCSFMHHFENQSEEKKNEIMSDVYDRICVYQNSIIETQQLMCSMLNVVTDGYYPTTIGLNGIDAASEVRIKTRAKSLVGTAHKLRRELICEIEKIKKQTDEGRAQLIIDEIKIIKAQIETAKESTNTAELKVFEMLNILPMGTIGPKGLTNGPLGYEVHSMIDDIKYDIMCIEKSTSSITSAIKPGKVTYIEDKK
ncbi:hypothetical protein ABKY54_004526 [Vibrio harveyi]